MSPDRSRALSSSPAAYLDRDHFDVLNDDRAEASIGTGEPITLTDHIRRNPSTSPAATSLNDAASRQPAEHQAPSVPAPMMAIPLTLGPNGAPKE